MSFKPSKTRSRSWNDSTAPTGPSIWSRDFKPACPSASLPWSAAPLDQPPNTRGKEKVVRLDGLRLPCRELQVKRPREGELSCSVYISTCFLIQRYQFSHNSTKKPSWLVRQWKYLLTSLFVHRFRHYLALCCLSHLLIFAGLG